MPSEAPQNAAFISVIYPDSQASSEIFGYSDFHVETHALWRRSVGWAKQCCCAYFPSRRID